MSFNLMQSQWRLLMPWLVLVMWVCSVVHLLLDIRITQNFAGAVVACIAIVALFSTRGTPRRTLVSLGGCALVLAWFSGTLGPVWSGVVRAALFASFLASLFALSAVVRMSNRISSIQNTFDSQSQSHRSGVLQCLGLVFAVPLAVGAVGIISPLVSERRRGSDRVSDASWAMRGMGLAVMFSPFTVAMGVAVSASDASLPVGWLMVSGLVMAFALLIISFYRGHCAWPEHLAGQFSRDLVIMLWPVLLLIAINMGIVFLAGFTPLQAAILTVLPYSFLAAGIAGFSAVGRVHSHVKNAWRNFDGEIAVFVASLCFAQAVANVPQASMLVDSLTNFLGPTALIVLSLCLILGLAMVGVHMVVTATLFVTVFNPVMVTDAQQIFLALAALMGWSLGTMIAVGSLAFVTACKVLDVPGRKVATGVNLKFSGMSVLLFCLAAMAFT